MAEYKQLTLSQCAAFDHAAKHPTSRWEKLSTALHKVGNSRSQRIARGEGKRGGLKSKQNTEGK